MAKGISFGLPRIVGGAISRMQCRRKWNAYRVNLCLKVKWIFAKWKINRDEWRVRVRRPQSSYTRLNACMNSIIMTTIIIMTIANNEQT